MSEIISIRGPINCLRTGYGGYTWFFSKIQYVYVFIILLYLLFPYKERFNL